ncbi:pyroglutamyl-peptidase I [Arthrobacter sp. UM1]|uniref:pyroglutamyl-peptidase I n=1 Tax=Arthrobacter sp. UM1 TaxID=2766776 RepID=UPI001CF65620|nr:pyroglutamyl-peptidase I [Arthrobacter sp. UM1]MCB4208481.1 pyroglutamyl-peptidase I [Arthrobacter sp. UM1]
MRILLTGFEPFGGEAENASREAVRACERLVFERPLLTPSGPAELVAEILPVGFRRGPERLAELVEARRPDLVLCVGEAGGRQAVTPERLARNRLIARIPDNDGDQPSSRPLEPGASDRPSTLDADALTAAVFAAGVPAEASDDAGGFVCNAVFWAALRLGEEHGIPAGFVHVPALRSHGSARIGEETDGAGVSAGPASAPAGAPLTFEDLGRALREALAAVLTPSPAHVSAQAADPASQRPAPKPGMMDG